MHIIEKYKNNLKKDGILNSDRRFCSFSEAISFYMDSRKISRRRASEISHNAISRSSISRWESGNSLPTDKSFDKFCRFLTIGDCDKKILKYLLDLDKGRNPSKDGTIIIDSVSI